MTNPNGTPLAATMPAAAPERKPLLSDLPPIGQVLADWMRAQAGAPAGAWWSPATIAAAADDRRPALAEWLDAQPWHAHDGAPAFRPVETTRGPLTVLRASGPAAPMPQQLPLPLDWPSLPAAAAVSFLGLNPEVKYALARYSCAIRRTDEAYDILERRLSDDLYDLPTPAGWVRLHALRRRREALRQCCTGHLRVMRFRCSCCGGRQHGAPTTCHSRTCPRCVRELRRTNQARIARILEAVDDTRRNTARPPARWRWLTLTAPSWAQFAPMRRAMGAAWARLHRREVWRPVRAAIAAWETTHTAAGWHVHMHAAVDAYLPHGRLAAAWAGACLVEWSNAVGRGEALAGLPGDAGELVDMLRAQPVARSRFASVARRLQRWAERHGLELRAAVADPRAAEVFRVREPRRRGTRRRRVLADLRPHFAAFVASLPSPAGCNVKEFAPGAERAHILGELAKYAAKDLGGAQQEGDSWGVAGTPERLAEWIAGSFRWRTLRTYGDAYDRPEDRNPLACETCDAEGTMQPDGAAFVSPGEAVAIEQRRRILAERRRAAVRLRWGEDTAAHLLRRGADAGRPPAVNRSPPSDTSQRFRR